MDQDSGFNQQASFPFNASSPFGSSQNSESTSGFGTITDSVFGSTNYAGSSTFGTFGTTANNSLQGFGTFGATASSSGGFNSNQTSAFGTGGFDSGMSSQSTAPLVSNLSSNSTSGSSVFGISNAGSVLGAHSANSSTPAFNSGAGFASSSFGSTGSRLGGTNAFSTAGGTSSVFGTAISSSGFGTGSGPSRFGPGTLGFGTGSGSSGFGAGSTASGFDVGANSGFGTGTSSTGFGTQARSSGFGTGTVSTGFGTGTVSSGFGTGTGSSVFGTGTGSSRLGAGAGFGTSTSSLESGTVPSSAGFAKGTGSSEFGSGTGSVFGTGTSGFGPISGTLVFGTGTASSGFGTVAGSAFGTGSSAFSPSSTHSLGLTIQATTASSLFENQIRPLESLSGFGNFPPQVAVSSPFGSTVTPAANSSKLTGSADLTAFNKTGSSVFAGQSSTRPQGLGGPSSIFSQNSASGSFISSTGSSAFGAPRTETNLPAQSASGASVGSKLQSSDVSSSPQDTSGNASSTLAGNVFGTGPPGCTTTSAAPSGLVFGAATNASSKSGVFGKNSSAFVFGDTSKPVSVTGSVFGGAARTAASTSHSQQSSETGPLVLSGTDTKLEGQQTITPNQFAAVGGSVFSVPEKSRQGFPFGAGPTGSVFGGASGAALNRESTASAPSGPKPLFPAAAMMSPAQPVSTTTSSFGSGSVHASRFSEANPPRTTSVFGERRPVAWQLASGSARPQETPDASTGGASSLFRGKQTDHRDESHSSRIGTLPSSTSDQESSSRDVQVKNKGGFQALKDGWSFGVTVEGAEREAQSGTSTSGETSATSVFGGKRGRTSATSVFGGKGQASASGFRFSAMTSTSGASSVQSQKRRADQGEDDPQGVIVAKMERSDPGDPNRNTAGNSSGRATDNRTPRRSSSMLDDVSRSTTLSLKKVPKNLNKGPILKRHFSRFGKIQQVRCMPGKGSATVQFETHEQADKAKKHGGKLPEMNQPLPIFWKVKSEQSPSSNDVTHPISRFLGSSVASRGEPSRPREESSSLKRYSPPSSVADELSCMRGGDSKIETSSSRSTEQTGARAASRPPRKELVSGWLKERAGARQAGTVAESRSRTANRRARSASPTPSTTGASSSLAKQPKLQSATLSSLRKMVGMTTMEKVSILDIRDKLLRQKLGKQTGIGRQAFVGTCPDMCPEKERLYREEVRRLSVYEIIPGSSTITGSTSLVDHTRAVKEYSRSSADQDEPLPHELRPLPVLSMTMNYLLSEIAPSRDDSKWAEWYDFLWNRTRSIRKEITQQQLCNQQVVELIEKCVRFHIFCSEQLCTEDMMVFDAKINNENLTKCLQTLKELYADMERNWGLFCANEAEFRAYIVMMNLNDGDTLREVQQLRAEVRESQEISFAVKVYSALNSNNYVRFFRFVKSASFLNACILHRYFNQIRARALQIILRAHTAGSKRVGFPLSEFTRLLSFESEADVREFCGYYGLVTEGQELFLDRTLFIEPESPVPSWRAHTLVESKRRVLVGEAINGGPLEPVLLPHPQCSFDADGRFIGSVEGLLDDPGAQWTAEPVVARTIRTAPAAEPGSVEQFEDAASPASASTSAAEPVAAATEQHEAVHAKVIFSGVNSEVMQSLARLLFWEVINDLAKEVAQETLADCQAELAVIDTVISDVIFSDVIILLREVSREVMQEERARLDILAATERCQREEGVTQELYAALVSDTVHEELPGIVSSVLREARAKETAERQERCVTSLHNDLLGQVCGEMALQVADQVFQVDVVARLQMLADLQKVVELRRLTHWLALWRRALALRQRQKRAMLDFPCAPPAQPAWKRLREMYPDRQDYQSGLVPGKAALLVNDSAQMTLLSPLEVEQRSLSLTAHLSLASLVNSIQRSQVWEALPLPSLIRGPLMQRAQDWLQKEVHAPGLPWKLLLSLPGRAEMERGNDAADNEASGTQVPADLLSVLCTWLCAKFTHGETGEAVSSKTKTIVSQYSVPLCSGYNGAASLRLGICVRTTPEFAAVSRNKLPKKEEGLAITKGTSAVLCLLPYADTADEAKWQAARQRLSCLLEAKSPLPPVPAAFLLPCRHGAWSVEQLTARVMDKMGLQALLDQGLLSSATVVELPVRPGQLSDVTINSSTLLHSQLVEAVKYLAFNVPEPPRLRGERLSDFVEDMMTQHFFNPILQDLRLRHKRGKLHQGPNVIIGLYNSLVDHMADVLTYRALQDISWPPPELLPSTRAMEGVIGADWNSQQHLGDIFELVTNLRLPWFHYRDPTHWDWETVCQDVWTFVNAVINKRCDSAVSLTTRISRVLARTCLQFENLCSLTLNKDHCTPTYVNAPWTDIIVACVEFRLQRLHNWQEDEDVEVVGGSLEVFFDVSNDDILEFEPPAAWLSALLDTEDMESHTVDKTLQLAAQQHCSSREDDADMLTDGSNDDDEDNADDTRSDNRNNNRSLLEVAQEISEVPENLRTAFNCSQKLLLQVTEERQRSQSWSRTLERVVRGDTVFDINAAHTPPLVSPHHAPIPVTSTIWSFIRQVSGTEAVLVRHPELESRGTAAVPMRHRKLESRGTPAVPVRHPALESRATPAGIFGTRVASRVRFGASTAAVVGEMSGLSALYADPLRPSTSFRPFSQTESRYLAGDGFENVAETERTLNGHNGQSLSARIDQFKEDLQAHRRANELFEKRLTSFLES